MNEKRKKWLTIIPPLPASEFDTFLSRWREENQTILQDMDATRFVVDVIRSKDGKTQRRLRMELS